MNEKNYRAHLAILGTNILFGLNTPISKNILLYYLNPYSLTFIRMAGAGLLFWILSLLLPREKISKRDFFFLFLASLFGIFINQFSFIQGLSHTSPINAAIIITSTPIMTMIVASFFLKEPITLKKAFGVLLGASGAILLILTGYLKQHAGEGKAIGDILCFLSSLSYAIYLTAFRWLIVRYHPVHLMKWMFLFASILSFPFCLQGLSEINFLALPLEAYSQIAYVVLGATFITYLLIPIAQKSLRPTTLTMYNYLQPLVTSCIAVAFGIDAFGWQKTLAAILIFLGVYLVIKSKSRAQLLESKKQL